MTTIVVTPAESIALVSLGAAKAYLGIEGDSQDDTVTRLIAEASERIQSYLGRPLVLQVYRQRIALHGRMPGINLSRGPVTEIQSLSLNGRPWGSGIDEIDVDRAMARIMATAFYPAHRIDGPGGAVADIVYAAGYLLPGQGAPATTDGAILPQKLLTIPDAIAGACFSAMQMLYSAQGRDPTLKTESVQGVGSTTWQAIGPDSGGLPPDAAATLDRYPLSADWMA